MGLAFLAAGFPRPIRDANEFLKSSGYSYFFSSLAADGFASGADFTSGAGFS
jgi:hypothetical protein